MRVFTRFFETGAILQSDYDPVREYAEEYGIRSLGLMANKTWLTDPKRLTFTLARYKFVAKMLDGYGDVVEVGCGDAWASRIVAQHVDSLTCLDCDKVLLASAPVGEYGGLILHDMLDAPVPADPFDAAYLLDVLEHVNPSDEAVFLENVKASVKPGGVVIVGMPSLESQQYASPESKAGHVNCKSGPELKARLQEWFRHVFLFSMNDEVVHTGYSKMAHYLLALCVR